MNTKIIEFDLNKELYGNIVAKQGDTKSRFLLFKLLDGAIPFNLTNRSVRVYGLKKDGTEIFNDLIINDATKGCCTLELTNQILAIAGEVKLELMIIEGDKKLTSNVFTLEVRKSINSNEAVESSNEFISLLNALKEIDEWNREFADKSGKLEELYIPKLNELNSQLEQINDFNKYPQSPKPPKTGVQTNSYKIIKKTGEKELTVIQKTNKGYIKYVLERGFGASQEGIDYGGSHDLLRIVNVSHLQDGYVYTDVASPKTGTYESVLYQEGARNIIEQLLMYTPSFDNNKAFSSKGINGLGCYGLKYGMSVEFEMEITSQGKANLLTLSSPTCSKNINIYVNGIKVKNFNPRQFYFGANGIGIVEFDVPTKSTTNDKIRVKIENADSTGLFYLCALNYKKLNEYEGEYITDFKFIGSDKAGWIESKGASDYAMYDYDKKLWLGSYHGGEVLEVEQITWSSQRICESEYYLSSTTLKNIELNDWRIQEDFKIYQRTNLANDGGKMVSIFSFNVDGTIDMDFGYSEGTINVSNFYTALTCTHTNFQYLFYPFYKYFGTPLNEFFNFQTTEGKISQVNSIDGLQLDIRFTKFNESKNSRGCSIADNVAYRKFYYGVVYGKPTIVKNVSFSKSLDFIVR